MSGSIDVVAGLINNDGAVVAKAATFGAVDNGTFTNRNEFVVGPPPGGSVDIDIPWESSASSLVNVLPNRDGRFAASYTELGRVILWRAPTSNSRVMSPSERGRSKSK